MENFPILSFLIWWPVIGAVLVLAASRFSDQWVKAGAAAVAFIEFAVSWSMFFSFDTATAAMQFTESIPWVTEYKINYSLGIDGFSLALILLASFTSVVVVLAGSHSIKKHLAQYMATFLITQAFIVGVFCATDAILFYVFWEAMLVPMYLSIGMWGGKRRVYASTKFFLYTFLASVLMLIAFLYLHSKTGTFVIQDFYAHSSSAILNLSTMTQYFLFFAFLFSFAVKIPLWPLHTWLPDAHTEAPAGGSVVLAALMLKLGIYGFIRLLMPITPFACQHFDWLMIALALVAIVYIGFVSIAQTDMKKLIAYSSIAHMGFAVLGCFMVYRIMQTTGQFEDAYMSIEGAVVQMISHAFGSGALFLGVGALQHRMHTRVISDFGGVAKSMPILAALLMVFAMSNVGLPGTAGFVGEFMVILSAFKAEFWVAFVATTSVVLSAGYTLWMFKRVFFGPIVNEGVENLTDLSGSERLLFYMMLAGVFSVGLYPQWLLNILHASVKHLLTESIYWRGMM
jgi:NADH-quinone oxidoreductase subunit M